MSDAEVKVQKEDEVVTEEKEKVSTPLPQTAGANLEKPIMENIKVKRVQCKVTLDFSESDIVELIEKNESVEFIFNASELPVLSEKVVLMLSHDSRRNYYRELDAKEAFDRRAQQEADDEFMGDAFESMITPTFSSYFKPTAEELEKYPADKYVFVHKRPEEVAIAERAGYKSLGTVDGTPVTPKGEKAYANMVRMVVPKEQHDKMVRYFGKKSSSRVGGSEKQKKTEYHEIDGLTGINGVEINNEMQNDAESLRLRELRK